MEITRKKTRTPFVYWAQREDIIYLRVDIRDAKECSARLIDDGRCLEFSAITNSISNINNHIANGIDGISSSTLVQNYAFSLPLFSPVDTSSNGITTKIFDNRIELKLRKKQQHHETPIFWPRVVDEQKTNGGKLPWLRFDFDRWADNETDIDDRDISEKNHNEYLERMLRDMESDKVQDEDLDRIRRQAYLILYNTGMWLANLLVLLALVFGFAYYGQDFIQWYWGTSFSSAIFYCTLFQLIDLMNAICGLTSAGYKAGLLQVTGRLSMLALVQFGDPTLRHRVPTFLLMIIYLLAEQVRYPYFALQSAGKSFPWLTRLRYSAWMVLYPVGFLCEGILMTLSVAHFWTTSQWSLVLPNPLNFAFNFGALLASFLLTGFPWICYTLLAHMSLQRRRKLGKFVSTERKSKGDNETNGSDVQINRHKKD